MNKEWSELNKSFQELIIKKETFNEGKKKLLELRKKLFETNYFYDFKNMCFNYICDCWFNIWLYIL